MEINKAIETLKMKIEAISKNTNQEFWKWNNLGKSTGYTDANIVNRKEDTEERILVIEDMIEEIDMSMEMLNLKNSWQKIYTKSGIYKKTKPKINLNKGRRFTAQRPKKYFEEVI